MKQQTLAMAGGFEQFGRQSRRAEFLSQMELVVPWAELVKLVEPHYPASGKGRPPVGVERMLRIYFLQQWFNLSDPAVEDALYESPSMRSFVGIDLGREPAPDETTVCKFRHLLERHQLGRRIFAEVNGYLERHGLKIGTGTIVDATLLQAPSSTKNKSGARDTLPRRACLRSDEAQVRLRQSALPRSRQESQPARNHLRPHQPLHRTPPSAGRPCAEPRLKTGKESSTTHHPPRHRQKQPSRSNSARKPLLVQRFPKSLRTGEIKFAGCRVPHVSILRCGHRAQRDRLPSTTNESSSRPK